MVWCGAGATGPATPAPSQPPAQSTSQPPPNRLSYAAGDPVESWLHELLCLDAAAHLPKPPARLPHPSACELFFVERDTLFSYHK
jgi:N-acetyltransferase 10